MIVFDYFYCIGRFSLAVSVFYHEDIFKHTFFIMVGMFFLLLYNSKKI